jgi:hypothetical protein
MIIPKSKLATSIMESISQMESLNRSVPTVGLSGIVIHGTVSCRSSTDNFIRTIADQSFVFRSNSLDSALFGNSCATLSLPADLKAHV